MVIGEFGRLTSSSLISAETELCIEVIAQWMKYRQSLSIQKIIVSYDAMYNDIRHYIYNICIQNSISLSFIDTVKFILGQSADPVPESVTANNPPVIIINLDEAHILRDDLRIFLNILIQPLMHNIRVFPIISGLRGEKLVCSFTNVSIGIYHIILPLLEDRHVYEVISKLLYATNNTTNNNTSILLQVGRSFGLPLLPPALSYALK